MTHIHWDASKVILIGFRHLIFRRIPSINHYVVFDSPHHVFRLRSLAVSKESLFSRPFRRSCQRKTSTTLREVLCWSYFKKYNCNIGDLYFETNIREYCNRFTFPLSSTQYRLYKTLFYFAFILHIVYKMSVTWLCSWRYKYYNLTESYHSAHLE